MDGRALAELEKPPFLERTYRDSRMGFRALLVVDSLACDTAVGGIRLQPTISRDATRRAARVMTLKNRFVGLPNGGAKAAVLGDEQLPRPEKARRLSWFAEQAKDLIDAETFGIAPDFGTDNSLIEDAARARGLGAGRRNLPPNYPGSAFATARSVVEAISVAFGMRGDTIAGKTVALEGFGNVGAAVSRLLSAQGARIVALSNSARAIHNSDGLDVFGDPMAAEGASEIAHRELLTLTVDLLVPCGPGGSIDEELASTTRASVIVPAATNAFGAAEADILHRRGVLAVPCFVANCGGVAAGVLAAGGVPWWAIDRFFRGTYRRRVCALLARAQAEQQPPLEVTLLSLPPLPGSRAGLRRPVLRAARALGRSSVIPRLLAAPPTYLYLTRRAGRFAATDGSCRGGRPH